MNQNEKHPSKIQKRPWMKTVVGQKGMTLVELMVYVGLLSFTVLVTSTLIFNLFQTQARVNKTQTVSTVVAQVTSAARNPNALRTVLAPLVNCIQNPSNDCAVSAGAINLDGISACYSNSGQSCACSDTCSVQVVTNYNVLCSGGSGTRASCPASQASIRISYAIQPHAAFSAGQFHQFQTIIGSHVLKPDSLWGDQTQVAKGATTTELKKSVYNNAKSCPAGEVVIGMQENGNLYCKKIDYMCAAGSILVGYNLTNPTLSTFAFTPKCVSIICPLVSGKKQVFAGIDPVTETAICRPLNNSNTVCSPYTAGVPNGNFMVGLDANSQPICRKKTCLPGEIFAGWDASGNATCVTTGFIPKCVSPTCQYHTATPPGPAVFYSSATAPAVPIPFEGIPYISAWSGGRPTQGARHALRNWGSGVTWSSPPVNIFFSTTDTRGASKSFGGTSTTCQVDAAYAGNLTCLHSWQQVTRADGDCPADTPSTRYNYIGGNQCQYENWQCLGPMAWVPAPPPAPGATWTCTTTYGWVYGGTTASETRTTMSEWGTLTAPVFGGSGFTSNCVTAEPFHANVGNPFGGVGFRKRSQYSNFTLVAGCNYVYTP